MKREEEINIAAKNKYPYIKGLPQSSSHQAIFIEGAEWADKTMLDRACEWLSIYYPNIDRMGIDEFVTAFRQAMEGE
jgi:hypothetical protein